MVPLPSLPDALVGEPPPALLPAPLPLAHMTVWRWLDHILHAGQLEPRHCKVFDREWLYFSYGGLFYRTADCQTQQASELPVGFVFSPNVIRAVSEFFPFDSGAMANGVFGSWRDRMEPFAERFRVAAPDPLATAPRLIHELYGSNRSYLRGVPDGAAAVKTEPLPLLYEFLQADLSASGVDHRQRTLEGLSAASVTLAPHLLWIGVPRCDTERVLAAIYERTRPEMPEVFEYDEQPQNFNPREVAKILEQQAYRDVIARYVDR